MAEEGLTLGPLSTAKRKPSEPVARNHGQADSKRIRLQNGNGFPLKASSSDKAFCLPAETWHRIFSLVPPKSLGSLLLVNKLFHGFLDPPRQVGQVCSSLRHACASVLSPMKPNAIWQASRELFWPQMPSPLRGKTELDMWRLCCSKSCQFCGARRPADVGEQRGEWNLGPGAEGVAPLFPFAFVSCAKCLSDVIIKESDLLLSSSTPSFLLAGLSMTFLSSDLHVIPHQVLSSGKDPLHVQVNKVFSSEQVKALTAEFEAVRALGTVLTNGWARGLEARGKIAFADYSRFEKWLICGGVHQMRTHLESTQSCTQRVVEASSATGVSQSRAPLTVSPQYADDIVMAISEPLNNAEGTRKHASVAELKPTVKDSTSLKSEPSDAVQDSIIPSRAHSKSLKEAVENPKTSKKAKKADASETGSQKALPDPQVSDESVANDQQLGGQGALPPAVESGSENLTHAEKKLQSILSGFVDEIIRQRWPNGPEITKAIAPIFAVDVLLDVRRRFYSREARDEIAQSLGFDTTKKISRKPFTPKLSLGDMRWIFETKISKFTNAYSKNIFWCNDCAFQTRPFDLQGVVQHYAAKHTKALSAGTTVVQWQAEWPEKSIFHPNPKGREYEMQSQAATKASSQKPAVTRPVTRASARLSSGNRPSGPKVPQHGGSGPHFQGQEDTNVELAPANVLPVGVLPQGQYSQRLTFMTKSWNGMSKEMAKVEGLSDATTAYLLLYHVVKTFQSQFREPAYFNMFWDGLSHQRDMHFARKIKCLQCKACELMNGFERDRKLLTLPQLAMHFHADHITQFDWRVDMVSTPEGQASTELCRSLAMRPVVFRLISRALPRFVPREFMVHLSPEENAAHNNTVVQRPSLAASQFVYGSEPSLQGQSLRVSDPRSALDAAPGAMRPARKNVTYDVPAESYYGIKREPLSDFPGDAMIPDRSVAGRGVDDPRLAYAYATADPQRLGSHAVYRLPTQPVGSYHHLDDVRDRLNNHLVQRPMQHDGSGFYSHSAAGFVEPQGQTGFRQASRTRPSAAFGRDYDDYDPRHPAPDNRGGSLPN